MAVTGEGLEKFEDMIVRAAETTAAHARAARAAIGAVIFGQEQVVDRALITVLSGGHALLVGVPGLAKTKLVETMGIVARARRAAHPVHARPDAVRHSRHRGAGGNARRQALVPLHLRPDLRAAADGRRDQPRLPAHAVGAAAGDAGASRDGRGRAPRPAGAVPCAGDAEPAGAGRHLSAARGAARPLPDGDRRRLSGPRGRAEDPVRHHRRRGDQGRRPR